MEAALARGGFASSAAPKFKTPKLEKFGYTISCARDALKSPLSFVIQKTRCPDGLRSRNHQELGASV